MKRPRAEVEVNREIALQYRSIILKNKKKQQKYLDKSLEHMLKADLIPFGMTGLLSSRNMVNILTSVVDSDLFIQKFRLRKL